MNAIKALLRHLAAERGFSVISNESGDIFFTTVTVDAIQYVVEKNGVRATGRMAFDYSMSVEIAHRVVEKSLDACDAEIAALTVAPPPKEAAGKVVEISLTMDEAMVIPDSFMAVYPRAWETPS
jgi:hypothetical protein